MNGDKIDKDNTLEINHGDMIAFLPQENAKDGALPV